ncbi:unnamed protein product [Darwinula stevensoni]|uniref:Alpha-mannosidase n=1 Tax=Darwinula stevensoni TaxID=69355 RepID=A0A7R8X3K4_9CRUS|nr:unnamed protein product [Darwinula stevensoni]CAG0884611.1 unnamed protein product [Darwinula stevensoni]
MGDVIVLMWSHLDPGWLDTADGYYNNKVKYIIENAIFHLQKPNFTFMFTEIEYLDMYWQKAHETKKQAIRDALAKGSLEISTGGWIMTDEAVSHYYSMLVQLIEGKWDPVSVQIGLAIPSSNEGGCLTGTILLSLFSGHKWIEHNLGKVKVKSSWSVDPFGHGSVMPYLLKGSGIENMAIQRIHFAWKEFFATHQLGDFFWQQAWDFKGKQNVLCHNLPFDIYDISHTCGPHFETCKQFDLSNTRGDVTYMKAKLPEMAAKLVGEYQRMSSLFPHNVVIAFLGEDFKYDMDEQMSNQYQGYRVLVDYINSNKETYNTNIRFGTLSDYFNLVRKWDRSKFPTLQGDFHVYSDVFSWHRPAYWSGYYTTRPLVKSLDRFMAGELRSAEILYSYAVTRTSQTGQLKYQNRLEALYPDLVKSRRTLSRFQHHDIITGTSRQNALLDQENEVAAEPEVHLLKPYKWSYSDYWPVKIPVTVVPTHSKRVVVFNSLAQQRIEVIRLNIPANQSVRVTTLDGQPVPYQINPVWNRTSDRANVFLSDLHVEVAFVATLPPLSAVVYELHRIEVEEPQKRAAIFSNFLHGSQNKGFVLEGIPKDKDISIENDFLIVTFNGTSGEMNHIQRKQRSEKKLICQSHVLYYETRMGENGAYLFKVDAGPRTITGSSRAKIVIVNGDVETELAAFYGEYLVLSYKLYHHGGPIQYGIQVESILEMEAMSTFKLHNADVFMKFNTAVENGNPPVFYTDGNGFNMQKRVLIDKIGVEGNYYPVTTAIFIEDAMERMTILTSHSHGASSLQTGSIEIGLDRRADVDDGRGLGEGIVHEGPSRTYFWLLPESRDQEETDVKKVPFLSLLAIYLSQGLNYPPVLSVIDSQRIAPPSKGHVNCLSRSFPCDIHLLGMRHDSHPSNLSTSGTSTMLMLHRLGYDCALQMGLLPSCSISNGAYKKHDSLSLTWSI